MAEYEEYVNYPLITKQRMFMETMSEVLPNLEVVIESGDGEVVKYYPVSGFKNGSSNDMTAAETVVGKGKCTRKHWNLEPYLGKKGEGYRMISSYPWSSNFNSITFFIKQAA